MARFLKKKEAIIGQVPGALVFVGEQKVAEATIRVIDYDQKQLSEKELHDISEGLTYKDSSTVTWININGLHDLDLISEIGKGFGLHALVLEDIVNTGQRPRMEEYDNYLFFALKMMRYDPAAGKIRSEQLTMVLGKTFLLTFQEQPGDVFEPVRERIRKQKGRIRKVGIDYLAYALLDTVVDNYLFIIERLGEEIEDIENEILDNPTHDILFKINAYKREMNYLRKTIRPVREFILQLSRVDSDLIQSPTLPFFKDLLDLSNQAVDAIDSYREMLSDHLNIYDSRISNRLNEIMKVLTIFSAIFIPLTFIAGIYGTNFENVPELHFRYSYFIMWGVMVTVALFMLRFFRSKKWL
ncbi:MAG: magnesium/cobalt transporter CorA [Deltaproteobacteria bacterium]|jgi:magnesium transporter|nr:magnesium/cobalt transporter CorA [Deltaproteobacteria bacterium]MCW9049038.1 magnesium/cobalt transporter CorA [Deltaproteobacteria bacterium]